MNFINLINFINLFPIFAPVQNQLKHINMTIKEYIDAGLQHLHVYSEGFSDLLYFLALVIIMGIITWIVHILTRQWLARIVMKLTKRTSTNWDDLMFDQRFFNRLGLLISPIVTLVVFRAYDWTGINILMICINIWITISFLLIISSVLDGINRIYESYPVAKNRPIKVFIQVIKIFFYCATTIIIISILLDKNPATLLAGLGALSAVLMLVFKDAILGFVAGIQLISNRMVNIGDWIVMPGSNADGDVIEINLTTVKVQNWDKTISTIPTYKLVSESFTNWRGMQEAGGRRIKRSVNIDIYSVHYLSDEDLENLKQSSLLKNYIENKQREINEYNARVVNPLDKRRLTNLGTFREYMEAWLTANPDINLNMTHMVRQLQPTATGIPLEIYCFTASTQWLVYERAQADVFDHLFAILPLFKLKVFQYPTNMEWMEEKGA